jgi:hypothetical protein
MCIRYQLNKKADGPKKWLVRFVEIFENRKRTLGYSAPALSIILTELPPVSITNRMHGVTYQKAILPTDTALSTLRNRDYAKATF